MAKKFGTPDSSMDAGERQSEEIVLSSESVHAGTGNRTGIDHPSRIGSPTNPSPAPAQEEKISLFWRVFGGTILSIVALVAVTLYNSMNNAINELRGELHRINEARADLIKKDEFNSRNSQMWTRVQELGTLQVAQTSMKEQLAQVSERLTSLTKDHKDQLEASRNLIAGIRERMGPLEEGLKQAEKDRSNFATLKERVGPLEDGVKQSEKDHGLIVAMQTALANLQERIGTREQQLKDIDLDSKALTKELLDLRERLAKLEVSSDRKTPTRTTNLSRPIRVTPPMADPMSPPANPGTAPTPMVMPVVPGYELLPMPRPSSEPTPTPMPTPMPGE
ncbi:hypothetical protein [Tuwongella immobilis]|uniref:Uncharacterized protein n=1 Tax=Tuwongella immobilis TaxID=692036 RepID=A0A6C2YN37_9BACT|nr:hypothetical protein [Tuwongella immobilis]VIP02619.1 unnamed protein product [Tuwongella immobilis]VTS01945.1 unnamed protein product [Tuwongella immobilis]